MHLVLEGRIKYKEKKKWKIRYVMLMSPETTTNHLIFHVAKDPAFLNSVFQSGDNNHTGQFFSSVNSGAPSWLQSLPIGSHFLQNNYVNSQIDNIFGYEIGRHVDKEFCVIVLIGLSCVHCMAMPSIDEMFRWADVLKKYLSAVSFHVTLRKSLEGSRLHVGPGNLHIQHNRLCLIGEPVHGNKFICAWAFEEIENLEFFPCHNHIGSLAPSLSASSSLPPVHPQVNSPPPPPPNPPHSSTTLASQTSTCQSTEAQPCYVQFQVRKTAGRGRGKHLFQMDDESLRQFRQHWEVAMARRAAEQALNGGATSASVVVGAGGSGMVTTSCSLDAHQTGHHRHTQQHNNNQQQQHTLSCSLSSQSHSHPTRMGGLHVLSSGGGGGNNGAGGMLSDGGQNVGPHHSCFMASHRGCNSSLSCSASVISGMSYSAEGTADRTNTSQSLLPCQVFNGPEIFSTDEDFLDPLMDSSGGAVVPPVSTFPLNNHLAHSVHSQLTRLDLTSTDWPMRMVEEAGFLPATSDLPTPIQSQCSQSLHVMTVSGSPTEALTLSQEVSGNNPGVQSRGLLT